MNLNEKFLSKSKRSSSTSHSDKVIDSTVDSVAAKRPQGKQTLAALSKYTIMFPEKVCHYRWLSTCFPVSFALALYIFFNFIWLQLKNKTISGRKQYKLTRVYKKS